MFSVYQHWDPLRVCIVGRSYPPEFYSWIKIPHVRSLFEKIAIETEEDYQAIIKKLKEFNVKVVRPAMPTGNLINGRYTKPPMTPRDHTVMIGDILYANQGVRENFILFYQNVKDPSWPECQTLADFFNLPSKIKDECINVHKMDFDYAFAPNDDLKPVIDFVKSQGNTVKDSQGYINGAMVSRIGKDLYFGTDSYIQDTAELRSLINTEFKNTRNHVVNTGGHSDGTYCPVCPGLIISLNDVPSYAETFPGWEVVYLPNQSWDMVKPFLDLKTKNQGKWWIPGFENDQDVTNTVETWLNQWVGYVEETVFDVNMLIVDPKNVIVFNYNKLVFDALDRYGITPHIVPFRHRYFWDGGIHCVTSDLHREGAQQDYFKERN